MLLTQAGLEVIACYCPLNPENKLEHVLIPALSLGFVSSSALYPTQVSRTAASDSTPVLTARCSGSTGSACALKKNTAASLIAEASASLKQAQDITDRLESIYTPHLNDAAFRLLAESIVQALPGINGETNRRRTGARRAFQSVRTLFHPPSEETPRTVSGAGRLPVY